MLLLPPVIANFTPNPHQNPVIQMQNLELVLQLFRQQGIETECNAQHIAEGRLNYVLGLLSNLSRHYHLARVLPRPPPPRLVLPWLWRAISRGTIWTWKRFPAIVRAI